MPVLILKNQKRIKFNIVFVTKFKSCNSMYCKRKEEKSCVTGLEITTAAAALLFCFLSSVVAAVTTETTTTVAAAAAKQSYPLTIDV